MAKNCINDYYRCLDTYKALRIIDKTFWMEYTSALIAYLHKYIFNASSLAKIMFYVLANEIIYRKKYTHDFLFPNWAVDIGL